MNPPVKAGVKAKTVSFLVGTSGRWRPSRVRSPAAAIASFQVLDPTETLVRADFTCALAFSHERTA